MTLRQYLDHYRMTFEMKCGGLTPEQLAARSVPPSTMSLLGLVRHLAKVEHPWFRRALAGEADHPRRTPREGERDRDFVGASADRGGAWRRPGSRGAGEVAFARELYADPETEIHRIPQREPLGGAWRRRAHGRGVRRHCGHADLLRECIDGRTGQ